MKHKKIWRDKRDRFHIVDKKDIYDFECPICGQGHQDNKEQYFNNIVLQTCRVCKIDYICW